MVPIRDLGNEDLSNLTPEEREAAVVNRRTTAEMLLCVVYHLPLLCLRRAMRCLGCVGAFRARIGCSGACVGREPAGSWFCISFAACRQAALLESMFAPSSCAVHRAYLNTFAFRTTIVCNCTKGAIVMLYCPYVS